MLIENEIATRNQVVKAIQTLYDGNEIGFYPLGENMVSDVKDTDKQAWKRSIQFCGLQFHTRLGMIYQNIKNRCLIGGILQRTQTHYLGTTMCEEWASSFDAFAEWASTQIGFYQCDERGKLFEVDKDLLGDGDKQYSSTTCCFLPKAINVAISSKGKKGYCKRASGKYQVKISKFGKSVLIGLFATEKEATRAYKRARKAYIRELAKKYKHQIPVAVYARLMAYKQAS